LKPVVRPSPTEVGGSNRTQVLRPCALPCENNQTKLGSFSRLACSTLLSKIRQLVRLSGAVGSRLCLTTQHPRTCCADSTPAPQCVVLPLSRHLQVYQSFNSLSSSCFRLPFCFQLLG
jgi:hypothetical protein